MNDDSINYDKDVLYHLNQIALNCENLQLNYNRDRIIIRYAQNTIETIQIIEKLYQFSNNSKLIEIGRRVNELFEFAVLYKLSLVVLVDVDLSVS